MDETLSPKQQLILNCIKQSLKDKGYPPSVRELCASVGLSSTSTVHSHLNTLEKKGYIKRDPSKPRTIEVLDDAQTSWVKDCVDAVPIIGKVTAGSPILAVENIDEYFPLPKQLTRENETFMLNVSGTSMINAGIMDGDQIIVRKQDHAYDGEIVVAMIDDEVTVKRFYKEANRFKLKPENDEMDPIYTTDLKVLGKVVGLFRKF